jgi:pimeloyl-ACP methyl ester carboxylesterase
MSRFRKVVRIVWPLAGLTFMVWLWLSFQARNLPEGVMNSDTAVTLTETDTQITFQPTSSQSATGLLFYPGAMVEPTAYAPLARTLADAGYLTVIVKLPWGTAPLASHEEQLWQTTQTIMAEQSGIQQWVLSGHSRGAAIAARTVYEHEDSFAGLILIGTSHPKEAAYSLADARLPITKIYGMEDGLASQTEIEAFRGYLPEHTIMTEIAGANHAQFGYYGMQLGDSSATISREEQQRQTAVAILTFLEQLAP